MLGKLLTGWTSPDAAVVPHEDQLFTANVG